MISSGHLDLIDIFLAAESFNPQMATIAFSAISPAAAPNIKVSIGSKLLAKGASGIPLHEALVYAVRTDHTEVGIGTVKLLRIF